MNSEPTTTSYSNGAPRFLRRLTGDGVVVRPPSDQSAVCIAGPSSATPQARPPLDLDWVVEESFEATVEEIREDSVRLHTVSSGGEEGEAWLPMTRITPSEQKWIALGVPMRIAVLYDRNAHTRRRESFVRVLRPTQWRAPVSEAVSKQIADRMFARMQVLLGRVE